MRPPFLPPPSEFYGTDNVRIPYGDWTPTHFSFELIGDKIWLIVGPTTNVSIMGKDFILQPVPENCNIKGMVDLKGPCVARRCHKVLNILGIRTPNV